MNVLVQQGIAAMVDGVDRATDVEALFGDVSDRLRRFVPFDGATWFATDPQTVLGTAPVRVENVEPGHCDSFWERECRVEDAILFRDLARDEHGIGTLYEVTDHRPARSARYREFLAPQGYGDELRAAFRCGDSTWGVVGLFRERVHSGFTAEDIAIVRALAPALGSTLRTLALTARVSASSPVTDGPGTALFDAKGVLVSLDDTAERLFTELCGSGWQTRAYTMTPVRAVVSRAIAIQEGTDRGPASARIRSNAGRWLSIHASCLRGTDGTPGFTALTIEPAKSAQIAPIIVEAYCLTPREQEITRAVARGLSNQEIARELYLSPFTVRDHLKAIFTKVGVGSRGELVAKLFADHYGPAMHEGFSEHVHR